LNWFQTFLKRLFWSDLLCRHDFACENLLL
jgi:hypothetical protein